MSGPLRFLYPSFSDRFTWGFSPDDVRSGSSFDWKYQDTKNFLTTWSVFHFNVQLSTLKFLHRTARNTVIFDDSFIQNEDNSGRYLLCQSYCGWVCLNPLPECLGAISGSTLHLSVLLMYTLGRNKDGSNVWVSATHLEGLRWILTPVLCLL